MGRWWIICVWMLRRWSAVRRAAVQPGEYVLVIGAGPIGLGTMEAARIAGGRVIALDINADRLRFCRDKLRVLHTVTAGQGALEAIQHITRGSMPKVVMDAMREGFINPTTYITHRVAFDRVKAEFPEWLDAKNGLIKAMIEKD
jgi:threonine dehydrogenase-like Zn-dependent dehydrogenase